MTNFKIETFNQEHESDFIRLNTQCITRNFQLDKTDQDTFKDVQGKILNNGGQIFFALNESGEAIGCCALVYRPEREELELTSLAVEEANEGKEVDLHLASAALEYARKNGAKKIYAESNTKLEGNINLFHKLGFHDVILRAANARNNIMLERYL